ncbi:hypothetical protein Cylst_2554 [Cylindrospermum stagnale PCC 7417]|uniref:Uncharacterized protein n=1 Tax=Cylindrospermum stagnale PCC 7417 TaxID=56107 RepID=K9WY79_9NOST|nr:hypothetical protein [Cylindrospermum stagnale]AFZ24761.1 hypothetical protein Cylst_2554 [Cylindrospermum stagnale PCC 7417]
MIDIEQLAKIAYKARHPEDEHIWEDALDSNKDFYRLIAAGQKTFIESEINRQVNKSIKSFVVWAIYRLIPIIQDVTHREKARIAGELLKDLTEIKFKSAEEPDPDDIPFELGGIRPDMSPENY